MDRQQIIIAIANDDAQYYASFIVQVSQSPTAGQKKRGPGAAAVAHTEKGLVFANSGDVAPQLLLTLES